MKIEIDTSGLFNKLLWLVIAGAISFSAKKVNDMSNNIAELNLKMSTVMMIQANQEGAIKDNKATNQDHEYRLRKLEDNRTHAPVN